MSNSATDPAGEARPGRLEAARIVGVLGGVFLGGVLLVAAGAKALDPTAFAAEIRSHGLDFLLPAGAVALLALAIEAFLGTALVLAIRRWWTLGPAAALVAFFLFLTGRVYWRALHGVEPPAEAGCGCFGNLVQRTPAEAFWQDALLMVPALLLAFVSTDGRRNGQGRAMPWRRLGVVGAVTAAVVLLGWKAPELPLDNLATRLHPGVAVHELCAGTAGESTHVCLDAIVPELAAGEHVVVLADVADEAFGASVETLNEYQWNGEGPTLWVVVGNTEQQLFTFRFSRGPAFQLREAPAALLRPLYRTLPRSFLVRDGEVTRTWSGLPPLPELAGAEDP